MVQTDSPTQHHHQPPDEMNHEAGETSRKMDFLCCRFIIILLLILLAKEESCWSEGCQHCFNFPGGSFWCDMSPAGDFSCLVLLCSIQWDVICQNMTRQLECVIILNSTHSLPGKSKLIISVSNYPYMLSWFLFPYEI